MRTNLLLWARWGILLLASPLCAQAATWALPEGGALVYQREGDGAASALCDKAKLAASAETRERLPGRYLPKLTPAAVLCAGERSAAGDSVIGQASELRELVRQLAFALPDGRVRMEFPHVVPFGDVVVEGEWRANAAGGEELAARWRANEAATLPGVDRAGLAKLRALCVGPSEGKLRLARQLTAARSTVRSFDAQVDLVVAEAGRFRRLQVREAWQLVEESQGQDAAFRKRVADGISRGAAWVRDAVADDRSYLKNKDSEARDFRGGRLALALLTMVHGGIAADDPVLVAGFAELLRRDLLDTYSLSAALMALCARHAPANELELLRSGKLAAAGSRNLPDAERQAAAAWVGKLLGNVDPRASRDVLRFNYEAGPRYDTSLQQYALLGLWSAQLCGIELPKGVFGAAGKHLLAVQQRDGQRRALCLTSYAQLRAQELAAARAPAARMVLAKGFAYEQAGEPAYGSMTSAGISGLLLARAGMAAHGETDRALAQALDGATEAGFAWLGEHFSVRCNPGFAERADNHWYYWLYCLERCCELGGIARIDGRDWYYEGAMQLFAQQAANGSFRSESPATLTLDATCFAVLFLAKATARAAVTMGQ